MPIRKWEIVRTIAGVAYLLGDAEGLAEDEGEGDGVGVGLGRFAPLARALLVVVMLGVVTALGETLAKKSASGTTISPATTVRTNVTAPHSLRSTPQFTSAKVYRRSEIVV